MSKISTKVLLFFFLPKKLESMDLGPSQQCVIIGCNVFLKELFSAGHSSKLFQTHMLNLLLAKFFFFSSSLSKYIFHDWGGS